MKILNVVNTTFELYYLSAVACLLLKKNKNIQMKLLIRLGIQDKITPEIQSIYSKIYTFEFPQNFPKRDKNLAKTIFNFFDNLCQSIKFRNYLKNFDFDIDIICISSFREYFANILCKHAPSSIRLVALRMADTVDEFLVEKTTNIKDLAKSLFLNIKNLFLGYSLMRYRWNRDTGAMILNNFVKYPYYRTIFITDHDFDKRESNYRLPPPFIALKDLYNRINQQNDKPAILVAGERTSLYETWDKDSKKYNEFLDFLRNNFKGYDFYFKGRGKLTDINKLNLKGFQIISGDIPLEELCLKKRFDKVISIKSTCSKIGASFGYNSYLLYPMFNLPENSRQVVENYFQDMISIIRAKLMSDLIKEPSVDFSIKTTDLINQYYQAIIK